MQNTQKQTVFSTSFVAFNQRLLIARSNFIDFEILRNEQSLGEFILSFFELRKVYSFNYGSDMHAYFLQPKVEAIYDLLQNDIEAVRNIDSQPFAQIMTLLEDCFKYTQKFN
jgi:hypothetical protein